MKKKKGFTLIELLSVIVILSMIALIAVPVVYKSIQSSREKAYVLQVENIEAQAKKWAEMNTSELPNEDNDLVFVKVLDLKQEGYIKEDDIVDPRNNKAMNGCVVIQYDASYNQYEYTYKEEECDTLKTDEYQPIIVVEGIKNVERLTDTVEVNTVYQYPNVKATDYKGSPIEVMGPVIMEKGKNTVISDVDTSVIDKEFELIYTAYDAKKDTEKKVIVTVTVVDTTPPVITVNGHTTDFSMTIEAGESFTIPTATATDNSRLTPTIDTSGSVNIKVPGNYKITYTATDSKGNIKTLILTVTVIDTILPTVTISGNPTTWTNQNVTIVVSASDSGSGLASSAYSYDGGSTWTSGNSKIISSNTTLNIWVKDNAGNTIKNTIVIDKIDKTIPDVTFTVTSGTSGLNYWYISNVGVKMTPSAGNSGVASYKYCTTTSDSCTPSTTVSGGSSTTVTLSTESATNKICVLVTSVSGQTNTKCSGNYKIDKSAPTLTVDGHTSDYTITMEPSPSYTIPSGSATDNVTSSPTITTSGSCTPNIIGTYTITYTAKDDAGNSKSLTLTVKVQDTIPPTVEITGNPTSWTNQNATIVVNASDSGSGLASSAYSYDGGSTWTSANSKVISSNTTLNIWVKDKVGNTTKKTVVIDKIDKSAPTLTVGGHTSSYTVAIVPASSYTFPSASATDNVTSNPTISISGTVNSNVEGTYPITYTARDEAGNSSSLVVTVKVVVLNYTFSYTGDVQSVTVPVSGTYKLEVWGAKGGDSGFEGEGGTGGSGAYASGTVWLNEGNTLYVVVGGAGNSGAYGFSTAGGYNGGGIGRGSKSGAPLYYYWTCAGGGGATHIALNSNRGVLSNYSSYQSEVLIVAGGGGGGFVFDNGTVEGSRGGAGGTGGGNSFGQGGDGENQSGGGGGWSGGISGNIWNGGSGGGTSYTGGVSNASTTNGQNSGNGSAKISFVG